ncbi:helix-turn-helix domain-containing protein [Alicyclobacillus kakegawensis]|uniref:helix-turn-helix domain-containing protein n=1 Tax=Alicyclobacillus kakegawensis TaxID=392012 RepID=UPI000A4F4CFC|nr:helix-turn-helix domain-containing protein [Alicyclobacillus kakegawensis]
MPEVSALSVVSEQSALEHILRHHAGADGWITIARREGDSYKQYHYRVDELPKVLSEWLGTDVYFSQNTFYRPSRKIEYIRQLRALYVDVDCYLLNFDPDWVIGAMEAELFRRKVPEPNLIIHSGRGLGVVWLIEPVPARALPLWQAVENYLVRQLTEFGGDAKASDAARILRVAGTINSKSNEPVLVQYRHDYRYQLRDIEREYLPPLSPAKLRERGNTDVRMHRKMFRVHSLHYARLMDLVRLCELRKWHMTGYREVTLFLYRYWSCCFLADPDEALRGTLELNEQFTEPLSDQEVIRATRSAEKAWQAKNDEEANRIAREKGYPGAGYNISNTKLIEWLDITEDEQRHLETIIGRRVKYERNNQRRSEARRAAGKATREEYLAEAEKRRREAIRLRSEGMSYRAIAKAMNTSLSQVQRMLKSDK